jgi:hypothetical protein
MGPQGTLLLAGHPDGVLVIADQAAESGQAILAARSLRLTEIATRIRGHTPAAYKRI